MAIIGYNVVTGRRTHALSRRIRLFGFVPEEFIMRFTFLASIIILALTGPASFGGGPDVRCKSALIESVVTDETRVILMVSGRCELFLVDSKLPLSEGNAKFVTTDMEHCVITLVRRNDAMEGMGFKDWKDCCQKTKALTNKRMWLDFQGSCTIDSAQLVSIRATAYSFAPPESTPDPSKP